MNYMKSGLIFSRFYQLQFFCLFTQSHLTTVVDSRINYRFIWFLQLIWKSISWILQLKYYLLTFCLIQFSISYLSLVMSVAIMLLTSYPNRYWIMHLSLKLFYIHFSQDWKPHKCIQRLSIAWLYSI